MKEFDHIENLENAVKWNFFKNTLGWDDNDKIAYEMFQHLRRLTEWTNKRAAVITKLIKSNPGKVKEIRERLEKEYPLPKAESRKILKLDVIKVVKIFKEEKLSLQDLAKKLKCDFNEFRLWWIDNLPVINQEYKKER